MATGKPVEEQTVNMNAPQTKGEQAFNLLNYWGMGWIGNTIASVAMAWALNDSKAFSTKYKNFLEEAATGAKGNTMKSIIGRLGGASRAREFFTMSALMAGGFVVLWPMKAAEDKKIELVKKLDEMIDGKDAVEREENKAVYARIEAEPKQGWVSFTVSRVAGLGVVYGAQAFLNSRDVMWSGKAARWLDKLMHRNDPKAVKQIEEASKAALARGRAAAQEVAQNTIQGTGKINPGPTRSAQKVADNERLTTKLINYSNLDLSYSFGLASLLFGFTRMMSSLGVGVKKTQSSVPATNPPDEAKAQVSTKVNEDTVNTPSNHATNITHDGRALAVPHQALTT